MLLVVRHLTHMHYPHGAAGLALRLRLWPRGFEGQDVHDWHVSIDGHEVTPSATDGYGGRVAQWLTQGHRDTLDIVAHGVIETEDQAGVVRGLRRDAPAAVFLRDTILTESTKAIAALAGDLTPGSGALDQLHVLSERIRGALPYRTGITDSGTSAADALSGEGGVCQDHAHIFIAAARAAGVPARYVAGYLLAGDEVHQQFETHAWAEAYVDHLGWVGFDVSNGVSPTDHYVRLCTGLDAQDAAPVRGLVTGGDAGTVSADVRIAPATPEQVADLQQQQQQQQQQQ